jgi:hypothetical protein
MKTKICRLRFKLFTTHHPNVFTLILSLSEGRTDIAWVPSNKMPLASPHTFFSLLLPFYSPS